MEDGLSGGGAGLNAAGEDAGADLGPLQQSHGHGRATRVGVAPSRMLLLLEIIGEEGKTATRLVAEDIWNMNAKLQNCSLNCS